MSRPDKFLEICDCRIASRARAIRWKRLFFSGKSLIFPKNLRRLASSRFLRRIQKKSDGEKERKFVNDSSIVSLTTTVLRSRFGGGTICTPITAAVLVYLLGMKLTRTILVIGT
jgi:hypothetical protein